MKLTATTTSKRKSGMTLLELTVVILVLLSLISVLFIGARAWKKGSDKAASILQIRNVQQGVRSNANLNGLNLGDAMVREDVIGAGKFVAIDPVTKGHPAGTAFDFATVAPSVVPLVGVLYLTVTGAGFGDYMPTTGTYADW